MTTSRNGKWQLWLASFLATGVVWTYFVSRASAQNAGTITITNSNLTIGDRLSIPGQSKSGSILVTPRDSIQNIGNGGNISVNAGGILISQTKASDTSSAQNIGNGGNISVNAGGILTIGDQLSIPGQSKSGSILLTPRDSIQNIGNGGNISVNADRIRLVSVPKASDTSSAQNIGNGGNISLNAKDIRLVSVPKASDTSSAQSIGNGGNISLNAKDIILISRTKASDTSSAQSIGNGGNISINANSIRLVSVPEPSHTSGILVFAVLSVASVLKRKQKNGAGFKPHD